ncbi:MAG: ABC transporter permease subunit [Dehalococcoidia bacterium]
MGDLIVAEFMKVRTRWMPYVLFLIALAGVSLIVWIGGYVAWMTADGSEDMVSAQQSALRALALPWSLVTLLDAGQFWGSILVGVLTASVVATEHSWGTVRQSLIRGHTRGEYLLVKALGISLVSALGLLVALGIGIVFSMVASDLAGVAVTLDVPGGPSALGIVVMIARTAYTILPYGLLAFMLTVVSRSTAVGAAGIILFVFIESTIISIFGGIGGGWAEARGFLLGHNVAALLAANRIDLHTFNTIAPREQQLPSALPDPWVAALVVGVYCVAFAAIAYWSFARRDVRAPDGG